MTREDWNQWVGVEEGETAGDVKRVAASAGDAAAASSAAILLRFLVGVMWRTALLGKLWVLRVRKFR